ncbi:hypothetical protein HQN89_26985 [Paenibacillus frigoriresistens]|uniref:hypothetical protein n=1 Tax=Paenibacillus alginolyticus TaxID=59839 RepID=UPI0015663655|nr:hypothetical protein [Paenibacillus frigoriresistens]NRF94555.1 hypothetical protein [Paenibacillus frigoriresistens]
MKQQSIAAETIIDSFYLKTITNGINHQLISEIQHIAQRTVKLIHTIKDTGVGDVDTFLMKMNEVRDETELSLFQTSKLFKQIQSEIEDVVTFVNSGRLKEEEGIKFFREKAMEMELLTCEYIKLLEITLLLKDCLSFNRVN